MLNHIFFFLLGSWKTNNVSIQIVDNIKDVMETVIEGDEFSFITGDNVIIMMLKSRMSFDEIDGLLHEFLTPHIGAFFLMPKPRKLGYRLDKNLEYHLFGKKHKIKKPNYIDPKLAEDIAKHFKSIVDFKIRQIKRTLVTPHTLSLKKEYKIDLTVDNLLDKIIEKGMGSLTDQEIKFLNNYKN